MWRSPLVVRRGYVHLVSRLLLLRLASEWIAARVDVVRLGSVTQAVVVRMTRIIVSASFCVLPVFVLPLKGPR